MKRDKVLSMMGLAMKAGRMKSGEFSVEKAVKSGQAFLVIVAEDASDNTKKKFFNMCSYYEVPYYVYESKETLGYSIGREQRSSIAFLDEGFAKTVEGYLKNNTENGGNLNA